MNIANISSLSTALSQSKAGDAVGTLMLQKTLKLEEQNAQQLIASLPQPPSNPANLGNSVDIKV